MSILDSLRSWQRERREHAREEAERKAQAQGKLNDEVIAEGEQAERKPPLPGQLGPWES
jgi:hypothetical protein